MRVTILPDWGEGSHRENGSTSCDFGVSYCYTNDAMSATVSFP